MSIQFIILIILKSIQIFLQRMSKKTLILAFLMVMTITQAQKLISDILPAPYDPSVANQCCDQNTITVSGRGEITVKPDIAVLSISIQQTASTTQAAIQAANRKISDILAILARSVRSDDIATSSLTVYPQTAYQNGQSVTVGQTASQSLTVTVRNIGTGGQNVGPIIDAIAAVDGVMLNSIEFKLDNRTQATQQARASAFKDAQNKAQNYANFAGVRIIKVSIIRDNTSQDVRPIPLFNSLASQGAVSAFAPTTIQAGTLTVTADTTIVVSFL